MAISFNDNAVTSTDYLSYTVDATANHWRVDDWEDGTTEGGSSGSCLWDEFTQRCVGQLHGGYASCSSITSDWYGKLSVSWTGGGTDDSRLSNWLDPGDTGVTYLNGDPHITTIDGTRYDFQGAGEYVALRDPRGAEVQVRQAPIATTFNPGPNPYHGLATCVSLNTAVAARVGEHRLTYQPDLSGVPNPDGLELRVDGERVELPPEGIRLSGGGRIAATSAPGGIEVTFPERYTLVVTPGWWSSQSKWYLNVSILRSVPTGVSGSPHRDTSKTVGGLAGVIPWGSWLPVLPDGSSIGPMPAALDDRYVDLYEVFGKAWRVDDDTSLFDYAPGTSTSDFTLDSWPGEPPCELADEKPVDPLSLEEAKEACRGIRAPEIREECVFDVRVLGEPGFARTYGHGQDVLAWATDTVVRDDLDPTRLGQPVTFTATVTHWMWPQEVVPRGEVQFKVDGRAVGEPVELDEKGSARWRAYELKLGTHEVTAVYIPAKGSSSLSSNSSVELHAVISADK